MSEKGEKKGSNANRNAKSVPRAAKEPEKGPRPSKPSGAVPELDLFDYSTARVDAKAFNDAKRKLIDYATIHYDRASFIVEFGEDFDFASIKPVLVLPPAGNASPFEVKLAEERYVKGWLEHDKKIEAYKQNKSKLYGVLWGQCTTTMRHKLMEDSAFNDCARDRDALALWKMIKVLSLEDRGPNNQNPYKRIDDAQFSFGRIKQYQGEKIGDFYDRFLTEVEAAEACGVSFENAARVEALMKEFVPKAQKKKKRELERQNGGTAISAMPT